MDWFNDLLVECVHKILNKLCIFNFLAGFDFFFTIIILPSNLIDEVFLIFIHVVVFTKQIYFVLDFHRNMKVRGNMKSHLLLAMIGTFAVIVGAQTQKGNKTRQQESCLDFRSLHCMYQFSLFFFF